MEHKDLSISTIERALSFLDYDSLDEWIVAGMALKHELGSGGLSIWLDWASASASFNKKNSMARWKGFGKKGGITIGSLIHLALNYGFKFDEDKPVSNAVKQERAKQREIAHKEAEEEEQKAKLLQQKAKQTAFTRWDNAQPCENHPYLTKKDILPHGTRVGSWVYKDDKGELITEENALLIPLYKDDCLTSLQAIFPKKVEKNGTLTDKFLQYGADKEGVYYRFDGFNDDKILLCEGWATGATLHEATQLTTYVAVDSGNLIHVARSVRAKFPYAHIIVCADNDQYKRVNTGLKSASKVACEVDADIVYPRFKETKNKPTDFNDLYLENNGSYDEILELIDRRVAFVPNKNESLESFNTFDLPFIKDAEKVFKVSNSPVEVACSALSYAKQLANEYPAFITMDAIRCALDHPLLSNKTHKDIMCRVHWLIHARKRVALTAIKPSSWNKKHNHVVVSSLDEFKQSTAVSLIFAPMASGKTKNVIKPFCEQSTQPFCAVAHRRSLVHDLASRLNIESYEDINFKTADLSEKVAVCLPSTQARNLLPFMGRVANLAVDEISQNIRFTSSKECKVTGANQEKIFLGFKQLINECDNVIVADASIDQTTLDFIEDARPDEVFTIVEQVPKKEGKSCHLYADRADLLTKVSIELKNGGKVWFSVESAERAEVLAQIYEQYNVLVISSKNSKTKKIQDFLKNIEAESKKYDMIIASPAISSGVSVEHQDCPHFTMIAGMASGHSICFSDFAQMLGRVRYVKDYHVYLQKNNKRFEGVTELSILTGLRQAQRLEGGSLRENEFSKFNAHIQAKEEVYRADFANGFVWFLEYYCFDIVFGRVGAVDYALSEMMKKLSKEAKERHKMMIKSAVPISKAEAEEIDNKRETNEAEYFQLLAFKLRLSLGMKLDDAIDDLDVDMFENLAKVDRFARYLGLHNNHDDSELNISLRKFQKAQIEATKIIFDGCKLDTAFFDAEACDSLIKRVSDNENRFMLSALRLIPSKYGQWKESKSGKLMPLPIPERSGKAVAQILDKYGLSWSRTKSSGLNGYFIKPASFDTMKFYAERRYNGLHLSN